MTTMAFDEAEGLLANPIAQIAAAFGWLLAANVLLYSLFARFAQMLDSFESLFFEFWWNLDRAAWLIILLTLVLWVAVAIITGLEPMVWIGAAGAFFVWALLLRNIAFDLPDLLTDLYFLGTSAFGLMGVALGLLPLAKAGGGKADPLGTASGLGAASTFGASTFGTGAAPAPSPAPAATTPAPAAAAPAATTEQTQPAGWYPDPRGEATWRWWDGSAWTDNTN